MGRTALKTFSWMLFLVMLAVTLHCVNESAHAMHGTFSVSCHDAACDNEPAGDHHSPSSPTNQDHDHSDCDSCISCVCQGLISHRLPQLVYNPLILQLATLDRFKHLPEVYLPKFIPPQNLV